MIIILQILAFVYCCYVTTSLIIESNNKKQDINLRDTIFNKHEKEMQN